MHQLLKSCSRGRKWHISLLLEWSEKLHTIICPIPAFLATRRNRKWTTSIPYRHSCRICIISKLLTENLFDILTLPCYPLQWSAYKYALHTYHPRTGFQLTAQSTTLLQPWPKHACLMNETRGTIQKASNRDERKIFACFFIFYFFGPQLPLIARWVDGLYQFNNDNEPVELRMMVAAALRTVSFLRDGSSQLLCASGPNSTNPANPREVLICCKEKKTKGAVARTIQR